MAKSEQGANPTNLPLPLPRGASGNLKSYSPTQLHFLMRLSHLQKQRRDTMNIYEPSDWHVRLIHKSLYSTYRDCIELGIGEEAKLLMAPQSPEQS